MHFPPAEPETEREKKACVRQKRWLIARLKTFTGSLEVIFTKEYAVNFIIIDRQELIHWSIGDNTNNLMPSVSVNNHIHVQAGLTSWTCLIDSHCPAQNFGQADLINDVP